MTLPNVAWGWMAEGLSWLFFGSFAVPIRSARVMEAGVHPLVYQSWKTVVFFASSWLVLTWTPFQFTPWGLLSGALWIPAGVLFILAVQNAGLAVGQGVAQSCMVAWSFAWSLIVFREPMWSLWLTALAMVVLIAGVVGMTIAMRPQQTQQQQDNEEKERILHSSVQEEDKQAPPTLPDTHISLGRCRMSRRTFGIGCACLQGFLGGSGLVPLKLAQTVSNFRGGIDFVISYACGAFAVQCVAWIVLISARAISGTRPAVPPLHMRVMLVPGLISGTLWSAGNICQIYAVLFLGVGVGSGCVQANMLVAGIWGIVYYREIRGARIILWACFALVALSGIMGLSLLQYFATT